MFDFKSIDSPKKLNIDFILSRISEAQIFGYYFGKFDLKTLYPSKFKAGKHGDRNPSTGFYISKSGKIIYNHLNGMEPKMDCFAFVAKMYNCSISDAIKRIATDFGLITGKKSNPMADKAMKELANFDKTIKKETRIHFRPKKWSDEAKGFWKSYYITKQELEKEGIYEIQDLYINDIPIPNKTNSLRFALTIPDKGQILTKVYSPGGTDSLKWVSNIPLDMPFGVDSLSKKAPFSFTAKAQKDRLVLMKFLPAVLASQNESLSAMPDKLIRNLLFYYPNNYLGWDPDEPGLSAMGEMIELGFEPAHVHMDLYEQEGIKDWSDLAKEKGLGAVENLLKEYGLL